MGAHHGGHATSFVARSPQGLHGHYLGKRSAEADAYYGYGHAVGLGLNNVHGLRHFGAGYGISQLHPSGHSFHTSTDCTRGRLRLSPRPMLTTDTDTDTGTDTDTDTVWDTTVWDTAMADTTAMDTVMDTDTATT